MKKTLSIIGLGAGMLAALSSCTHRGDTLGYEEAMPMSELAIGDSELPPWVLEGDDSYQIPAGDRTPEVDRNQFATPEPGESMAVSNGLTRQNQPALAHDDTVVDSHVGADFDLGELVVAVVRAVFYRFENIGQLVAEEDRNDSGGRFACAKSVVVACRSNRKTKQVLMFVHTCNNRGEEEKEL